MSGRPVAELAGAEVLVTGGAGFIGSHLTEALVARGARVRVLDNLATGHTDNLAAVVAQIELLEGDIRDQAVCREACRGMRYLFHQAALGSVPRSLEDPTTSLAVNVQGTANLFAAAREAGVERLIYASSSSVYGDSQRLPRREGDEGRPLSPYALSKRMNEQIASLFWRCYGLRSVGLRYFNVYGPRQRPEGPYAAVVPCFFIARLTGEPPTIFGDGRQSRDFTYVGDAVEANLSALAAEPSDGRAVNVASGARTTILELERVISLLTGGEAPAVHQPERQGDVRHAHADLTAASRLLGRTRPTELPIGLAHALDYYRRLAATG